MRPLVPAMPAAPTAVRSENLTAVSYRGYPWTEPGTPELGRSRNGSVGSGLNRLTKTRNGGAATAHAGCCARGHEDADIAELEEHGRY
ncbi:hypothetical protein HYQ46_005725 [Verticillium longisporum]|nr:hypothetical protein HYQ46_005725 [Verticillium longisporum]